jgi:predicted DNA-binding transcriptional regulator YafY
MAVILGLMAVRRLGMATAGGSESASAKVERVLPDELRERVRAFQGVLTLDMPTSQAVPDEVLARFSMGAYGRNRLWIEYLGGERGKATERAIDVYGLVYHTGYWYAVAYCHLREGLRIFRLDRVRRTRVLEDSFSVPPDFDALDYLLGSIASIPGVHSIEVLFRATLEQAEFRVPRDVGVLEQTGEGVLMRCYSDGNLEWMAHFLIGTRLKFTVLQPPELRAKLREIARKVINMAKEEREPEGDSAS